MASFDLLVRIDEKETEDTSVPVKMGVIITPIFIMMSFILPHESSKKETHT